MESIDECIKKRLLRKITPNIEKSKSSIKISESKIESAKELFNSDFFNESVIASYTSIFHSCRALLFRDGIQEKSHYATYIYIKEKYKNKIPKELINTFYHYQLERHNILYGLEKTNLSKEESEEAILSSEDFLIKVKSILS